jgi:hypothetical protein
MRHEDVRSDEHKFDDLLSEDHSLEDIAYRLSWSLWRTRRHYRQVCAAMGEQPDEE